MGKRNPIAKAVRTPVYRPRIVKSRKTYTRKGAKPSRADG